MKSKQLNLFLLAIAVLIGSFPVSAQNLPANYRGEYKQGEVIVKFKDDKGVTIKVAHDKKLRTTSVSTLDKKLNSIGLTTAEQLMPRTGGKKLNTSGKTRLNRFGKPVEEPNLSRLYMMTFEETPENTMRNVVEQLEKLDEVEYAYPNYYIYAQSDGEVYGAEPMRSQQWYLDAIRLPELWNIPKLEGAERPIIAIIDTGVDITHPDLADNIWTNAAEANGAEGEDDDNNGYKDDIHGWNFINDSPRTADYNGHGTHCAGIAAAVGNNGIGITGANPDAIIMPVTVMHSDGTGNLATMIQGIDYAVANGADIISMSFGTSSPYGYDVIQKAYQTAILIAAAGNTGKSIYISNPINSGLIYPGAFDIVLGVQASNEQNTQARFSNYDPDGPYYCLNGSSWNNYEIWAPGVNILSTYPGGTYVQMSGTSMATPLVAGAISRLLQTKEPEYYRDVWIGDIVAAKAQDSIITMIDEFSGAEYSTSILDVMAAYNFDYSNRKARLTISLVELDDTEGGDGDGIIDAGETIKLWPTLRSEWGLANNIKFTIATKPIEEDSTNIEIIENNVDFGYSLNRASMRSKNPLVIKVADKIVDGYKLKLRITATCDNIINDIVQDLEYKVENVDERNGVINEDMTLYPDKHYVINKSLAIPQGVTLTIMPGTRLEFKEGCFIQNEGKLIANGKPDSLIVFTTHNSANSWGGIRSHISSPHDTLSYCVLQNMNYDSSGPSIYLEDCVVEMVSGYYILCGRLAGPSPFSGKRINFLNSQTSFYAKDRIPSSYCNFINFINYSNILNNWLYSDLNSNNLINSGLGNTYWNSTTQSYETKLEYMIGRDNGITTDNAEWPSWLGTSKEEIIRPYVYDSQNPKVDCFTTEDLSNMPTRPYKEAHGIVWKVVVDGYDAQDDFAEMPPLGVGRHKFEVYYNRDDMDTTFTPKITMGTYEPYTQIPIENNASWSIKDSVCVYSAYVTVNGKLSADGLNRIRVMGGKDHDHFDIPDEYWRFNVLVQAAGSMATGFAAEAGLGKVNLTWNNENNDFEDAMGFNVYRYDEPKPQEIYSPHYDDYGYYWEYDTIMVSDTIRLNEMILDLETTSFTDYEVTPGETYYYYYKVLSTDLKEYDISNVVAATPLTSTLGDANASGEVDVADVITTVNYAAGMEPRPFIFEAADVNTDTEIDILDVIGIIRIIANPNSAATASIESVAVYWVKDGVVWLETPVDLAGVQVNLDAPRNSTITPTEDMNGFEKVSTWLSDNDYLFLAYSMSGHTLSAGRHPILIIGDNEIADIRLSDAYGHNVMATPSVVTAVENINVDGKMVVPEGIYDLMGRKISSRASDLSKLPHGMYIVNGTKVVK